MHLTHIIDYHNRQYIGCAQCIAIVKRMANNGDNVLAFGKRVDSKRQGHVENCNAKTKQKIQRKTHIPKIQWDCAHSNVCIADFVCLWVNEQTSHQYQTVSQPLLFSYMQMMNERTNERTREYRLSLQTNSFIWKRQPAYNESFQAFDLILCVCVCTSYTHKTSIPHHNQLLFLRISLPIHIMFNLYSNADTDAFANVMEFTHVSNNIYCVSVHKFCIQHIIAWYCLWESRKKSNHFKFPHLCAVCGSFCEFDFIIIRLAIRWQWCSVFVWNWPKRRH